MTAGVGTVLVVGTGLIGTSVALGLRGCGVPVLLADRDEDALATAVARGGGMPIGNDQPGLVVVAVPPAAVPAEVLRVQTRFPAAVVTDVSSAQVAVRREAAALGCDLSRFVGGHPMAGREKSGPDAAEARLFAGRPWVVLEDGHATSEAVALVHRLVAALGAHAVRMTAEDHDRAVALVSHAPHVVAWALAALLASADEAVIRLAGSGMADTVRIAGAPPELWVDILSANAAEVADVLAEVRAGLDAAAAALRSIAEGDATAAAGLAELLRQGHLGRARLAGGDAGAG